VQVYSWKRDVAQVYAGSEGEVGRPSLLENKIQRYDAHILMTVHTAVHASGECGTTGTAAAVAVATAHCTPSRMLHKTSSSAYTARPINYSDDIPQEGSVNTFARRVRDSS
jgi:hypothetical protein